MRYAALLIGLLIAFPASAEGWRCASDYATGATIDHSRVWTRLNFAQPPEFVIYTGKPRGFKSAWVVVGINETIAVCEKSFNKSGMRFCTGLMEFWFNKNELKFGATSVFTFIAPGSAGPDSAFPAFMAMGRCKHLDQE